MRKERERERNGVPWPDSYQGHCTYMVSILNP